MRVCLGNLEESTPSAMFHSVGPNVQIDLIIFSGDVANPHNQAKVSSFVKFKRCYPCSKLWWVWSWGWKLVDFRVRFAWGGNITVVSWVIGYWVEYGAWGRLPDTWWYKFEFRLQKLYDLMLNLEQVRYLKVKTVGSNILAVVRNTNGNQ